MANSWFKSLKEIIYCLYDSNGKLRVLPIGMVEKRQLTAPRIQLLKDVTELILNTDITSDVTKTYLRDRNITISQVNEMENERIQRTNESLLKVAGSSKGVELKKPVTLNSTLSRIEYEKRKLEAALGREIFTDILVRPKSSIENYQLNVARLLSKYKNEGDLRSKLVVELKAEHYSSKFDGDFIGKYHRDLEILLKSRIEAAKERLESDEEFIGYFNYLLCPIATSDEKVMADRKKLIELLNGEVASNVGSDDNKIEEYDIKNKDELEWMNQIDREFTVVTDKDKADAIVLDLPPEDSLSEDDVEDW